MAETNEIIHDLRDKLQNIISLYEASREHARVLENENDNLKGMLVNKDDLLNELETKNKSINLSGALLASSEDASDAKLKVNKIVREIDKCIALLNR